MVRIEQENIIILQLYKISYFIYYTYIYIYVKYAFVYVRLCEREWPRTETQYHFHIFQQHKLLKRSNSPDFLWALTFTVGSFCLFFWRRSQHKNRHWYRRWVLLQFAFSSDAKHFSLFLYHTKRNQKQNWIKKMQNNTKTI